MKKNQKDIVPTPVENGQQSDGTIKIPDALVPYFGSSHIKNV